VPSKQEFEHGYRHARFTHLDSFLLFHLDTRSDVVCRDNCEAHALVVGYEATRQRATVIYAAAKKPSVSLH
jgi:hypothetical protein